MSEVEEELTTMKVDKNALRRFHRYMEDLPPEEHDQPIDIRQFLVADSGPDRQEYQIPMIYPKPTATVTTGIAAESEVQSTSVEEAAVTEESEIEIITQIEGAEESDMPTATEIISPPAASDMTTAPTLTLAGALEHNAMPLAESTITVVAEVHKVALLQVPDDNVQQMPTKKRKASSEATIAVPDEVGLLKFSLMTIATKSAFYNRRSTRKSRQQLWTLCHFSSVKLRVLCHGGGTGGRGSVIGQ